MTEITGTPTSLLWKWIRLVIGWGLMLCVGCAADSSQRGTANDRQERGRIALTAAGQTSYRYDSGSVTPATYPQAPPPTPNYNAYPNEYHGASVVTPHGNPPSNLPTPSIPPTPSIHTYPQDNAPYLGAAGAACEHTRFRCGVQCNEGCCPMDWSRAHLIPWESYGPGEYVGPARTAHVPEYRLRVDDTLEFVYRLTGETMSQPYRFNRGDLLRIESLTAPEFDRELIVQPDGTITVPQFGQITAAGRSVDELRHDLDSRFRAGGVLTPGITVTPTKVNTTLDELRNTVDSRFGSGGQSRQVRVTPEGTIQLPAIGSVFVQGLNLTEAKHEVEQRYASIVQGIELTPILVDRAPRHVYVVGEVRSPGRYELVGPTTAMQGITLAGGWNPGAKLKEVVILRRDDNWKILATRLNLHDAFFGRQPCPPGEVWLRDGDVVILPKTHIQWTGDLVEQYFTRGFYGLLPVTGSVGIGSFNVF